MGWAASVIGRRENLLGTENRKTRATDVVGGCCTWQQRHSRRCRVTAGVLAQQAVHVRTANTTGIILVEVRGLRHAGQQHDHGHRHCDAPQGPDAD